MSPGAGAYRHSRRRDASRAELATLQMVIGDADVDNVDTAWTTRVLLRDHSVKYSAELMRGSRVMHRRSRTVDQRVKLNRVRIVRTLMN